MKKVLFLIFLLCCVYSSTKAQTLTLSFDNLEKVQGDTLMIGVYSSPKEFMKNLFKGYKVAIIDNEMKIIISDLKSGIYAIGVYVDENHNGVLDKGMFGIPLEKYGFSNNPSTFAGPPSFKKCSFKFDENKNMELKIEM
jgi:uncharacterized protein (DUF2141 family)